MAKMSELLKKIKPYTPEETRAMETEAYFQALQDQHRGGTPEEQAFLSRGFVRDENGRWVVGKGAEQPDPTVKERETEKQKRFFYSLILFTALLTVLTVISFLPGMVFFDRSALIVLSAALLSVWCVYFILRIVRKRNETRRGAKCEDPSNAKNDRAQREDTPYENCSLGENGRILIEGDAVRDKAYADRTWLKCVDISDSVETIGNYAFKNCVDLTEVRLPGNLKSLGVSAFEGCEKLEKAVIPGSVGVVEACAFKDCPGLKEVVLREGVRTIRRSAFAGCSGLSSIVLPPSLRLIEGTFEKQDVEYDKARGGRYVRNISYPAAFSRADSLKTVVFLGTAEEWSRVTIESGNDSFEKADLFFVKKAPADAGAEQAAADPAREPCPQSEGRGVTGEERAADKADTERPAEVICISSVKLSEDKMRPQPAKSEFHNCIHVFRDLEPEAEYFAEIRTALFTDFHPIGYFSPDWARSFPCGRYVIFVCERHSVYKNGERIYLNNRFEGRPDDVFRKDPRAYSILLGEDHGDVDRKTEDSGSEYFYGHGIWRYRQHVMFDQEGAVNEAKRLSAQDRFAAVVRYVDDYDMF